MGKKVSVTLKEKSTAVVRKKSPSLLLKKRSKYQDIELRRHKGGLLLKLNGSPQVHSTEEGLYHECVATLPMMMAESVSRVVILGGGDGLAARNILQFPEVKKLTLIELDAEVLKVCSKNPEWAALNAGALSDSRLDLVVGDAITWFLKSKEKFDVIIHDIEDEFTKQPEEMTVELYAKFYGALFEKLKPGGVWIMTTAHDESVLMLNEIFKAQREMLPKAVQKKFLSQSGVIPKTRVLLDVLFPHVRQWTIDFPILKEHTTFYMSKKPLNKLRRQPPVAPKHIPANILKRTVK